MTFAVLPDGDGAGGRADGLEQTPACGTWLHEVPDVPWPWF
ncbi:hypothetical protein [Streptomyces sodiiphilus]